MDNLIEKHLWAINGETRFSVNIEQSAKECAKISILFAIDVLLQVIGTQKYMWTSHQKDLIETLQKQLSEIG